MVKQVLVPLEEYEQLKKTEEAFIKGKILEHKTNSWGDKITYTIVEPDEYLSEIKIELEKIESEKREIKNMTQEIAKALRLNFFGYAKEKNKLLSNSKWLDFYYRNIKET